MGTPGPHCDPVLNWNAGSGRKTKHLLIDHQAQPWQRLGLCVASIRLNTAALGGTRRPSEVPGSLIYSSVSRFVDKQFGRGKQYQ